MGTGGLPDICTQRSQAQGMRVYISGKPRVPIDMADMCHFLCVGEHRAAQQSPYLIVGLITLDCGFETQYLFYIFNRFAYTFRCMSKFQGIENQKTIASDCEKVLKLDPYGL